MEVFKDIYNGIINSLDLAKPTLLIMKNNTLISNAISIVTFNFVTNYFIPKITYDMIGITLNSYNPIIIAVNTFFHTIKYIESISIAKKYYVSQNIKPHNVFFTSIIMIQIQLLFYMISLCAILLEPLTNLILNPYISSTVINSLGILFLSLYHSMYSYGIKWQTDNLSIHSRINIFESRWIYFISFGMIPSLLSFSTSLFSLSIYNVYMLLYLIKPMVHYIDVRPASYPRLNMKILRMFILKIVKLF